MCSSPDTASTHNPQKHFVTTARHIVDDETSLVSSHIRAFIGMVLVQLCNDGKQLFRGRNYPWNCKMRSQGLSSTLSSSIRRDYLAVLAIEVNSCILEPVSKKHIFGHRLQALLWPYWLSSMHGATALHKHDSDKTLGTAAVKRGPECEVWQHP